MVGLETRVRRYPNRQAATIGRRFFVRGMPSGRLPAGSWHDLQALYALDVP